MNLFSSGMFSLHSGGQTAFKIDCDALGGGDLHTLAVMATKILPPYGAVVGIPTGGLQFAKELELYVDPDVKNCLLIADDVLTTGKSFWDARAEHQDWPNIVGVTIFARDICPEWVMPIFTMNPKLSRGRDVYL